ncbi:MAG: hypothetical protein QM788_13925 [Roseateles sp.]
MDADFPDADRHFPAWPREAFEVQRRESLTTAAGLRVDFVDYRRR